MSQPAQTPLTEYTAGTETEEITRTIKCRLETSNEKRAAVEQAIEQFHEMAQFVAMRLPSFSPHEWHPMNNTIYRTVTDEFDDGWIKARVKQQAGQKVAEAFDAWDSNGRPGDRPSFDDLSFMRLSAQDIRLVENDRGFGLKTSFIPYDPVWFHIDAGEFETEWLERVTAGDGDHGSCELRVDESGQVVAHLVVKRPVEVYEPADVPTSVGVDIGESVLFSAAVWDSDEVVEVDMERGREFRHHRERLSQKRDSASAQGDLKAVRACKGERERYTDHVTHTASRRIVELASEHAPAVICLEDLGGYREDAAEPIHDWPFAELQHKIAYKATEAGLPVETVDPAHSSTTCRQCGATSPEFRDGPEFNCLDCGYEVHADVNAAINIARRASTGRR